MNVSIIYVYKETLHFVSSYHHKQATSLYTMQCNSILEDCIYICTYGYALNRSFNDISYHVIIVVIFCSFSLAMVFDSYAKEEVPMRLGVMKSIIRMATLDYKNKHREIKQISACNHRMKCFSPQSTSKYILGLMMDQWPSSYLNP